MRITEHAPSTGQVNLLSFKDRFLTVCRAVWHYIKKPWTVSVIASTVLSFLWWVADKARGQRVYDAGQHFLTETLPRWVNEPIGAFWFAVFGLITLWTGFWIAFVIVRAWWETRPKVTPAAVPPEPKEPEPVLPSPFELESIQATRILWRKVGKDATGQVATLLQELTHALPAKTHLAMLLRYPTEELWKARQTLEFALHDHSLVPLNEVTGRLRQVFQVYMTGVRWIHACEEHDIRLTEEPYATSYGAWQALHKDFIAALTDLSLRSDYSDVKASLIDSAPTRMCFERRPVS